ncbi:MAG: nucleoside-diphosphate sugar epimerase/dehydratase [Actinomycetota bacterium]
MRQTAQVAHDAVCWALALVVAATLRFDFRLNLVDFRSLVRLLPVLFGAQIVAGLLFGLYRGRWRFGGFEEVLALAKVVAVTSGVAYIANIAIGPQPLPRSVPPAAGIIALVLMAAGRYLRRSVHEHRRRPCADECQRLLVFGAGEAGSQIIRSLLCKPDGRFLPVALLDDDPAKKNLRIMRVPVVGDRHQIAQAAKILDASVLLIAIPSAGSHLVTEISELALAAGLAVKVLPSVDELVDQEAGPADIRDITPADLLGRHEVHTDIAAIAGYLTGKRVLVTGAGGSIGSELCRQIDKFAPAELVMVDRDESALHALQLSMTGRALLDSPELVLADLRDHAEVRRLVVRRKPDVIFHAAALKHLAMLERHPAEAVKTNVWATLNLLEAAVEAGVGRFVNISTDKAADPESVLGFSKRITERLTSHMSAQSPTVCLSVRFGNVLGSRGSVLTTFQAQIDRGGPITVTHPDVTRYFMTVEEAVQLVIQAGAIGSDGEVMVLDMGKPVRIAEVANVLAARSPRPIPVQFTGLRPGEKLHEVLFAEGEDGSCRHHPLISHVPAPPLHPELVREIDTTTTVGHLTAVLCDVCFRDVRAPRLG